MANKEDLALLCKGVSEWNAWRHKQPHDFRPDLSGADLRWAHLIGADLSKADLSGAHLIKANLSGTNLSGTYLSKADLSGTYLNGADLRWAHLSGTYLSKADLSGADLSGADLSGANLSEAHLSGTYLSKADLSGTYLNGADLSGAYLIGADLRWAHLIGADLSGAHLREANLSGANLSEAHLSKANLEATIFADMDLREVKGLEEVTHHGPSAIGIDTIYRSEGKIPEVFLRGAGVPQPFIVQMKALVAAMEPIQFYSCFISYSSRDQEFVERIYADLQAKSVRCWFAPEDLKIGDRFQEQIEESIRVYDKVMIVLSEASVKSRWVEREVNAAREREDRENRVILFPIRIDEAVMNASQPWAADVRRQRHVGDFRNWHQDHAAYKKACNRLVRDLQAVAQKNLTGPDLR
jgi:uncharacterized protein YjbI with pentapeptide repeats